MTKETPVRKFGDTELGMGLGCGFMILCFAVGLALLLYITKPT